MYKNKARIEHDNDTDTDEFDMTSVNIPAIPRRPHAVSGNFRDQVKLSFYCYLFLSYRWNSSVTIAGYP